VFPVRYDHLHIKKDSYPRNRAWRPTGLSEVEDSTLPEQCSHRWLGCHLYAPAALYSQKYVLVCISVRVCVNPAAMMRLEGLLKIINKIKDIIWTGTRDFQACSIVP
jgi:hypothetical protein